MKAKSQPEMVQALKKRFKGLKVLDMAKFSPSYKGMDQLWLRNAGDIKYAPKDKYPLLGLDNGYYLNKNYDLDIYTKFQKWCEVRGWYATSENYTMQLIKI